MGVEAAKIPSDDDKVANKFTLFWKKIKKIELVANILVVALNRPNTGEVSIIYLEVSQLWH